MTRLQELLPEYMLPSVLIEVDSIPLTPNGKVDRRGLEEREIAVERTGYVAPRTPLEKQLAVIWQELLGIERISIYDNFFTLGGDSIIAIQVVSRARRVGCELQLPQLFTYQTIAALAAVLDRAQEGGIATLLADQELLSGTSGLLPIQQWFFDQDRVAVSHYNQSILLGLDKEVSADELSTAVGMLLQQHDALRFRYRSTAAGWVQSYGEYIAGEDRVVVNLLEPDQSLAAAIDRQAEAWQRSLDI